MGKKAELIKTESSDRKRILLFSDCIFFAGCENMVEILMNSGYIKSNFDVTFVYRDTKRYRDGLVEHVNDLSRAHPLRLLDSMYIIGKVFGKQHKLVRNMLWVLLFIPLRYLCIFVNTVKLYAFMKNGKYDLLHINNGGYPGAESSYSAVFAAKLARIPKISYMVNNQALDYAKPFRFADFPLDLIVSTSVTKFITASKSAKQVLSDVLRISTDKIVNIYNGILLKTPSRNREETRATLSIPESAFLVTIVANVEKRKGITYAVDAVKALSEQPGYEDLVLAIRGDGPLLEEIVRYVESTNLKNILFIERQKNIMDIMCASDVILLPSTRNEDFPNVISESMGLGKVVISTRVAGIPEQIDHKVTGMLCEPRSSNDIRDSIAYCYNNDDQMKLMGSNAKQKFQSLFESEISIRNYSSFFVSLIND